MGTNVPAPTFGPTGFIIPSEAAILIGVQADINADFGGGLNPALNTPQGQLATSETAIINNVYQTFLFYTQQVDPAYSSGRMQDAIGRIYFMTRLPALPTVVACTCTGSAATIPTGALAEDSSGNLYTCLTGGTLPALGGSITLNFANLVPGPIPCPADTLTVIYQAIPGWDAINNASDGVLGQDVESRQAFETRRRESVAANARGTTSAVQGAVLAVPGVLDAFSYQNDTNSPLTYLGFTLSPNSIYVAAVGGTDAAVAQAIWTKKSPGCAYNGNTNVTVYDTNSGYEEPFPSYAVTFERPSTLTILFMVVIKNNAQVPANAIALVQAAIINAFAGGDAGPRARIGSLILASRFYAPVIALGAWAQIVDIQIGSNNTPDATFTAQIAAATMTVSALGTGAIIVGGVLSGLNVVEGTLITAQITGINAASVTASASGTTMTVAAVGSGALAAGQVIHGTGVTPGTTIVQQLTGSAGSTGTYKLSVSHAFGSTTVAADTPGSTGTYTVSNSQTISIDTAMTSATADFNSVQVNINQAPATSNPDIQVVLQ